MSSDKLKDCPSVEIRPNRKGELDEVIGKDVYAHLEQMDKDHWYLQIGNVQIWLTSKSKISAHYETMEGKLPESTKAVDEAAKDEAGEVVAYVFEQDLPRTQGKNSSIAALYAEGGRDSNGVESIALYRRAGVAQPTGAAEVERSGPFHISISGDHAKVFPQAGIADVVAFADWLDERLNDEPQQADAQYWMRRGMEEARDHLSLLADAAAGDDHNDDETAYSMGASAIGALMEQTK